MVCAGIGRARYYSMGIARMPRFIWRKTGRMSSGLGREGRIRRVCFLLCGI